MKTTFKFAALAGLLLSLSACGYIPEDVAINPNVHHQSSPVGHGKSVGVRVIDARDSHVIGGRPTGYGPAADITVGPSFRDAVEKELNKALRRNRFKPVAYNDAKRQLTVRITNLRYEQRAGFWTAGLQIKGSLEASARAGGRSFDRVYRAQNDQRIVVTPGSKDDARYVNTVVSKLINKLINDRDLMRALSR